MKFPPGPIARRERWMRGVWRGLSWEIQWRGPYRGLGRMKWTRYVLPGYYRPLTATELGEEDMAKLPEAPGVAKLVGVPHGQMFGKMKELCSWLFDAAYPDGKPIGATQLTIRRRGQEVVLQLKIADAGGLKLEVREPTLDRALAAIEALLDSGAVPWQQDQYPLDAGVKKRK